MNHAETPSPRRSFLTRLAAAVGAFGVGAAVPTAVLAEPGPGVLAQDEPWMKRLTAAQRVIFHSHEPTNGQALTWARTYLEAQKTAYGKRDDESNVLVGLNGKSIGLVFNDALWAKYPIAQTLGMSGTSNPNGPAGSNAVAQLQSRGVIILVCQNSLRASGQRFLPEPQRNDATARTAFADEARANLLPGIEIVPAMVATLQMAQDRGCRYIYAGG